jgi:tetratricopeptide (TPR) repeat protein
MYSLLVALAASAAAFLAIAVPFKSGYAFLPAFAIFAGTYFLLARSHSKAVEALMTKMQTEIQQNRAENAIRLLTGGYPHAKWVFLLRGQIDGQLGSLHFMQRHFEEAEPLLEKAWVRHWVAKGMLAAYWFRKHKPEKAFKVLDAAISASKKEPMLYGLKAFMQVKLKDRDGARKTLIRAKAKAPKSQPIAANLVRLQNGQDLQMWQFGDAWWNFHLEKPSQKTMMKMAGVQAAGAAKGAKKSMYR